MMGQLAVWGYLAGVLVDNGAGSAKKEDELATISSFRSSRNAEELCSGGFGFAMLRAADGRHWSIFGKAGVADCKSTAVAGYDAGPVDIVGSPQASCCAAGYSHAVFGTDAGDLHYWAYEDTRLHLAGCIMPRVPVEMVAAGEQHSLALAGGVVWAWGCGAVGQLGLGRRCPIMKFPEQVTTFYSDPKPDNQTRPVVVAIAAGAQHSAVITDDASLFTFGWGLYGQCGHDGTEDVLRPQLVSDLRGILVRQVSAGLWHTACLTQDGGVYCWGGNRDGQLGTGLPVGATTPQLIEALPLEEDVVKISCGARHTVALTGSGHVYSWGWNKYGQLGHTACQSLELPKRVEGARLVEDVACGWWHTLVKFNEEDAD